MILACGSFRDKMEDSRATYLVAFATKPIGHLVCAGWPFSFSVALKAKAYEPRMGVGTLIAGY